MCFGSGAALPEARPLVGDEDAVAGVAGVVSDLDRLVEPEAEHEVGECRDILRAVVRHAGDAIAVQQYLGCGGRAVFPGERAGVEDDAVGDAADFDKIVSSPTEAATPVAIPLATRGCARTWDSTARERETSWWSCGFTGAIRYCFEIQELAARIAQSYGRERMCGAMNDSSEVRASADAESCITPTHSRRHR